jgi:hypothetical protein
MRRWLLRSLAVAAAAFLAIQLVPYGRNHRTRPVVAEPPWPSPDVRALAKRACFDCHSNETQWPWYASVAPVSWLLEYDVNEARKDLNYSEWRGPTEESNESADTVRKGTMPPFSYRLLHPEARLTRAERERLAAGLTFGGGGEHEGSASRD